MSDYSKQFDTNEPLGSRPASDLDTFIADDTKTPLNERYSVEHVPLNSAETGATDSDNPNAQGRHIPGVVSVLFSGTTAEITSLISTYGSRIGVGAIALNTETGNLLRWDGSAFTSLGLTSVTYSGGDGIVDPIADNTIAVDFASEDEVNIGTSLVKVVNPFTTKWAYGNTEMMDVAYTTTDADPASFSAETECPYNVEVSNSITGASLNTGTGEVTLPEGVYELQLFGNIFIPALDDGGRGLAWIEILLDTTSQIMYGIANGGSGYVTGSNDIRIDLNVTAESVLTVAGHYKNIWAVPEWGVREVSGENAGDAITHQRLRILKKKLDGS